MFSCILMKHIYIYMYVCMCVYLLIYLCLKKGCSERMTKKQREKHYNHTPIIWCVHVYVCVSGKEDPR